MPRVLTRESTGANWHGARDSAPDSNSMEVNMASTDASSEQMSQTASGLGVDMALEVVTLPVSDVDRAKSFYQSLGWRLDIDFSPREGIRNLQFTPPTRRARSSSARAGRPPNRGPLTG
jgi:hypothetical protein